MTVANPKARIIVGEAGGETDAIPHVMDAGVVQVPKRWATKEAGVLVNQWPSSITNPSDWLTGNFHTRWITANSSTYFNGGAANYPQNVDDSGVIQPQLDARTTYDAHDPSDGDWYGAVVYSSDEASSGTKATIYFGGGSISVFFDDFYDTYTLDIKAPDGTVYKSYYAEGVADLGDEQLPGNDAHDLRLRQINGNDLYITSGASTTWSLVTGVSGWCAAPSGFRIRGGSTSEILRLFGFSCGRLSDFV